ncbi:MAG: DUF2391 family protein [Candidatus Omnitrophica bacterium]|nr:DUF2391 family protein [Candidatus Omnitrophota bacterium]
MESQETKTKVVIKRIGGYLQRIVTVVDSTGKVLHSAVSPFAVELRPKDILQIIVGATILAIPVGFTEETWILARELKTVNVALLGFLSLLFIASFVYFNFYRFQLKGYGFEYVKRVAATYGLSLLVVGLLLTIIEKCPWGVDNILAVKRVIITAFPASMAATISDTIK